MTELLKKPSLFVPATQREANEASH